MNEHTIFFADVLQEANVVHHVARLRLAQITAGGELAPAGTLIVPVQQLPGLARALNSLVDHLQAHAGPAASFADAPFPEGDAGYQPVPEEELVRHEPAARIAHHDYSDYGENLD